MGKQWEPGFLLLEKRVRNSELHGSERTHGLFRKE